MKRIIIAVDAGHGGTDPGAVGNGLQEAQVAAELANQRLASFARLAGHRVELTRPTGTGVSLTARAQRAVELRANLFVSVHINAASSLARGFQVWHHGGDGRSKLVAHRMHRMVADALPQWAGNAWRISADTERYRSGFAVLRGTWQRMPALLLEVGFLSNEADANLLRDPILKQATMLEVMAAIAASLAQDEV